MQYQEFNSGGYSENLNNQYRRTVPDSCDMMNNMKAGILPATEGGMTHIANDVQTVKNIEGVAGTVTQGFLRLVNSAVKNPEIKAQYVYGDDVYMLFGGSQLGGGAFSVGVGYAGGTTLFTNLIFIKFNMASNTWTNIKTPQQDAPNNKFGFESNSHRDSIQNYQLVYESEENKLIILAPDIWFEYYIDTGMIYEIKDVKADVVIDAFYSNNLMVNNGNGSTAYTSLSSWLVNSNNGDSVWQSKSGWFARKNPASVLDTVTNTTTTTTNYNVEITDANTVNPSRTYLIQPITKDGFIAKNRVVYAELGENPSGGALASAFAGFYNLSANAEVFNLDDMQSYVYTSYPAANFPYYSMRWEKRDNYYTKPRYEVLMDSTVISRQLTNVMASGFSSNYNMGLNIGNKKLEVTSPVTVNVMGTPSSVPSANEIYYTNIRGYLDNTNNNFTHVRVYRTIMDELSGGAELHHCGDFRLMRGDVSSAWNNDDTFIIPEINMSRWSNLVPAFVPSNGYPTKLYDWAYDDIVEQDGNGYNSWNLSFERPAIMTTVSGFYFFYRDNKIWISQKYRNNIVGETYWVDSNRAMKRISDNVLSMQFNNNNLYILTEKGLYILDNISVSVADRSEIVFGGTFTYRSILRNIIKQWDSKFSFAEQMFITSDSMLLTLDDYGQMIYEDGTIETDNWGYKTRYAGVNNLTWCSTLNRLVLASSNCSGILNQTFTVFYEDEIYNGWSTYIRNIGNPNFILPSRLSGADRLNLFKYKGEIYCLYYNSTGINIIQMFDGMEDNLIVEPEFEKEV